MAQLNYPVIPDPAKQPFPPNMLKPIFDPAEIKTNTELKALIEQFIDENDGSDYSFAHIVLGDYNLSDGHIEGCLDPLQIMTWFNWKLAELARHPEISHVNLSGESWERYDYDQLFEMCYRTILFLQNLLLIPQSIREGN